VPVKSLVTFDTGLTMLKLTMLKLTMPKLAQPKLTQPKLTPPKLLVMLLAAATVFAACGESSDTSSETVAQSSTVATTVAATPAVTLASVAEAASIQANPPADLVILDVRTQAEFDQGHLEGAVVIDFYAADFAEQLSQLDPSVPYLVYCQSGNRSGQATSLMADLGFANVTDVDGGIAAWGQAELPIVVG
jgi:phage shock protein E